MNNHSQLQARFLSIQDKIKLALYNSKRSDCRVTLIAVSKKQPISLVKDYLSLMHERGELPRIGENYVQEYKQKLPELNITHEAHLIGPLQSNKVNDAVALFHVIQSVHSIKILAAINSAAEKHSKVQKVFLQINVSRDPAKSGFLPEELAEVNIIRKKLNNIEIVGLMTILAFDQTVEKSRKEYAQLKELRSNFPDLVLELSMGMSDDFDIAIEEGATFVRIGTALFGPRLSSTS